jgi:hypothetical protein
MRLRNPIKVIAALSLMLSVVAAQVPATPALAQAPVNLSDIALSLADLPEGFEIDTELTGDAPLQDIGVTRTLAAKADPSEEHLARGPVRVWQQLIRLDQGVIPLQFFADLREQIIADQNLTPFPGATNNPNYVQLLGETEVDGQERVVYAVGRLRDNLISFTMVGGTPAGTTIQSAISLNDLSVRRYEGFRATQGAPALVAALFQASFLSDELPPGFRSGNIINQSISDRALAHNGVGEVDLEIDGPGAENRITYIVYASVPHAQWSFDDVPRIADQRGSTVARPDGYAYPVVCVMRPGEQDGRMFGATSCLGLVRNVEVSAFSLVADAEFGNMDHALSLMESGVRHLNKVASTVGQPQ